MWEDPIVQEVRREREKLAAQFNYDVDAIFADLRKRQSTLGEKLVKPRKQGAEPVVTVDAEGAAQLNLPFGPIKDGRNDD